MLNGYHDSSVFHLYLVLSKHIYKFGFVRNKYKENYFTRKGYFLFTKAI